MDQKQKNLAIAQICHPEIFVNKHGSVFWKYEDDSYEWYDPYDYCRDSHAIKDAIERKIVLEPQIKEFSRLLCREVLGFEGDNEVVCMNYWALFRIVNASAEQLCDVFLKAFGSET